MKIALTGSTGLVGTRINYLLKDKYEIIPVSSSTGVDITDGKALSNFLSEKTPDLILHLAAKTDVDGCEDDFSSDVQKLKEANIDPENVNWDELDPEKWKGMNSAFAVNAVGTKNIAEWAKAHKVKLIYISTDFVFSGEKVEEYSEEDIPSPINWYGKTKFFGEKAISEEDLIVRISFPYGFKSDIKKDLVWTIYNLLSTRDSIKLVSDQIITPTFIEDIAKGLDFLIEKGEKGLINLSGNNYLSPFEIGSIISEVFELNAQIEKSALEEFNAGRAPRPFQLRLNNAKLKALGLPVTDFKESLELIKNNL